MKVLSLFDGISCGQQALDVAGIDCNSYYASEINKYAIQITQKNWPRTIQLGDVNNWKQWNIPWRKINLMYAGFPCQSWSIAGNQNGIKDPRGKLFFRMMEILNHIKKYNPNVKFLFENVRMKKDFGVYLDKKIGCDHIQINSSLVSAQNRIRWYWTNIDGVTQPQDTKIYLKDILEEGCTEKLKSYCIDANYYKGASLKQYLSKSRRQLVFDKPSRIFTIGKGGTGNRVYTAQGKSTTLTACGGGLGGKTGLYYTKEGVRKLTPVECERLQTLPDDYTKGVSNTQRYHALGNGWTVNVIAHILSFI